MDPLTFSNSSLYNIGDILNLHATMDSFDDEDFESTMNLLDNAMASSPTSGFREDPDTLELNMVGLSDAFNPQDTDSPLAAGAQHSTSANLSGGANSCFSPDLKTRSSGRIPVCSDVYIKQEINNNNIPDLSPIMDSFLRESWDDIIDSGSRTARPIIISTTPALKGHGVRSSASRKAARVALSPTIGVRLTGAAPDAKWKVATRVHKEAAFAALTEVEKSVAYLVALRELSVLVYVTYTVEFVVASRKAARRKIVVTAIAFHTEEAVDARLKAAIARFARVTTVRCIKQLQKNMHFR
ncbi:hypothetical protein PsorP6_014425 [Peronosclerospora sorghi]|uniref:Uncharacterized protein n=1 Tax=Peronosclerospora sorghi TaxID=230839 RepID=A0ACC0VG83_9STRA|nr:hypothetical protein PsorP6_014425 [Peronosclerospora sorghi]